MCKSVTVLASRKLNYMRQSVRAATACKVQSFTYIIYLQSWAECLVKDILDPPTTSSSHSIQICSVTDDVIKHSKRSSLSSSRWRACIRCKCPPCDSRRRRRRWPSRWRCRLRRCRRRRPRRDDLARGPRNRGCDARIRRRSPVPDRPEDLEIF